MLDKIEFRSRINNLPNQVFSKTGKAAYTSFSLDDNNILHFVRVNTQKNWEINIDDLYAVYAKNDFINTTVIRDFKNAKVNSPSVAILMAINCIDKRGYRI